MKKNYIFDYFFTIYLILCRFCSILKFMKYNFSVTTGSGDQIDLDLYSSDPEKPLPVVIIVHGFKGFKDWGFFPSAGEYFSTAGYHSVVFNFSHNGITPGNDIFNELDKFAKNTISLEKRELKEIIARVNLGEFCNLLGKIFIIGHSRGGGVVLLAASGVPDISAIAVWSSISHFDRYTERQKNLVAKQGFLEIPNSRTGQIMRMNSSFFDDLALNGREGLSIEKALQKIEQPILAVHGDIDGTVPVSEAFEINKQCKHPASEVFIVPKADHTFKMVHPATELTIQFMQVLEKTQSFFSSNQRG